MKKFLLGFAALCVLFFAWRFGAVPRFDVVARGENVPLDTLNYGLPFLARALRANPNAQTFRVEYAVLPDKTRPNETLPRRLEYNAQLRRLEWHKDNVWFERFDGVPPTLILRLAEQKGGVNKLLRAGAQRSNPRE